MRACDYDEFMASVSGWRVVVRLAAETVGLVVVLVVLVALACVV